MKFISKLFGLVLTIALIPAISCEFEKRFFTQKLAPYDILDQREWENLYYIDESYYQPGGPIFVLVGGPDYYVTPFRLDTSHFFDIGREFSALLIATEHRFFGESRPTQNTSVSNLQYLTAQNAVDDVASLIMHLKSIYDDAPVVTHGFDMGGAIAVWLAQLYPDLVQGTWASAATLLAVKDFADYLYYSGQAVRTVGGDECYTELEDTFHQMDIHYFSGNYAYLEKHFNLCHPFTPGNAIEASVFFAGYALAIGSILRSSHADGIQSMCQYLHDNEDNIIGFTTFFNTYLPVCLPIDALASLEILLDTDWDSVSNTFGLRQNTYQKCREFGGFISSNHWDQPFGNNFPVELFQLECEMLFGPMFTSSAMVQFMIDMNNRFGGIRPNVTHVYFTDGELDASRTLGVLESYDPTIEVDLIPMMGAGAEMYSISSTDSPDLLAVKNKAKDLLMHWIMERK